MITSGFYIFILYMESVNIMEPFCANCQTTFIPQFNKTIQYYKMCETCRPMKTNINFDCINYDVHQPIETNKYVLKLVTQLIQTMNSDLVKLKVKSDNVIDIDIQNETIRSIDRMNNLKT